jgi:hypothetical protein
MVMASIVDEYDLTKGGTLPKYTETEPLIERINEYFESGCESERTVVEDGVAVVLKEKTPTIAGLALFLGFADRSSIYNYMNRNLSQRLSYIIKMAVSKIDEKHEGRLYLDKCTGSIFFSKHRGMVESAKSVENNDETVTEWDIRENLRKEESNRSELEIAMEEARQ